MKMYNPRNPAEFVEDLGDSLVEFYEGKGWLHGEPLAIVVVVPTEAERFDILNAAAPETFAPLSTEPPIDFDAIVKSKKKGD